MKIFKTKSEKEAFLKTFLLFFFSIEFLMSVILFLQYKQLIHSLKDSLYLEMKNYSYTFEGKKFRVELSMKTGDKQFYQLHEDDKSFYIYVPIPFSENEIFKIYYPKENFYREIQKYKKKISVEFTLLTFFVFLLSALFSFLSINPLRKAIHLIEEVSKDIIHDINTPISGILINLKILKMKHKSDKEIERIEQSVKQLSNLYENLRTLTEGMNVKKEKINLKNILEEEIDMYSSIFPNIKVEKDIKDLIVNVDEKAFRRVISNIIGNAFKHNIPKNGYVKVYVKENKIFVENPSKPIKNPEKLFERYYKESERGLGLGLSIANKLCNEIGCKIQIKTENDRFLVILTFP